MRRAHMPRFQLERRTPQREQLVYQRTNSPRAEAPLPISFAVPFISTTGRSPEHTNSVSPPASSAVRISNSSPATRGGGPTRAAGP